MRLNIVLDGLHYLGKDEPDKDHKVHSDRFFAVLKRTASYQHHCEDGKILVMGALAVQKAHFVFCSSEEVKSETGNSIG